MNIAGSIVKFLKVLQKFAIQFLRNLHIQLLRQHFTTVILERKRNEKKGKTFGSAALKTAAEKYFPALNLHTRFLIILHKTLFCQK